VELPCDKSQNGQGKEAQRSDRKDRRQYSSTPYLIPMMTLTLSAQTSKPHRQSAEQRPGNIASLSQVEFECRLGYTVKVAGLMCISVA
jgi:ABC-type antimicrobial peptide transport system ATPase subunit